jgi:HAD superfamily hydrolase (TIGR01509 family)
MSTSPRAIHAVVFDLDGLLFNTEDLYQHVGGEMLRRRGRTLDAALLDEMMGRPSPVALRIMIDRHGLVDSVDALAAETDEIFAGILDARLAPMPGAMELLDALARAALPKAIATSSRRAFVDNILPRFDLAGHFEFVLAAEDVEHGKPHPEIYRTAAQRLGIAPGEMMVLEDSENGCRAAVAAGALTVAVPGGHSRSHDFTGAALVAESLRDRRIYELLAIAGE